MVAEVSTLLPRCWTLLILAPNHGCARAEGGVPHVEQRLSDVGTARCVSVQPFEFAMSSRRKQHRGWSSPQIAWGTNAFTPIKKPSKAERRSNTAQRCPIWQQKKGRQSTELRLRGLKRSTRPAVIQTQQQNGHRAFLHSKYRHLLSHRR